MVCQKQTVALGMVSKETIEAEAEAGKDLESEAEILELEGFLVVYISIFKLIPEFFRLSFLSLYRH